MGRTLLFLGDGFNAPVQLVVNPQRGMQIDIEPQRVLSPEQLQETLPAAPSALATRVSIPSSRNFKLPACHRKRFSLQCCVSAHDVLVKVIRTSVNPLCRSMDHAARFVGRAWPSLGSLRLTGQDKTSRVREVDAL